MSTVFRVKVKTNQRKELIVLSGKHIEISVRAKPQLGAANQRIIALIAQLFKIPQKNVRITKGHHAPSKHVEVIQ